ncbi:hypothetical protein [Desulfobacterium sp. N47]|uniref:Uncharacterized protein n=1 Tax=uncultured Desulfobacterium sp. TaxID=201089 RepID=E1YIM1_9BACT|nr:unknown protein [uncultured Desulfobacterium sp.]
MTVQIPRISGIPEAERTPLVLILLEAIAQLREEVQLLKDEIARLKEYKELPDDQKKIRIESQFDQIFTRQTCFANTNSMYFPGEKKD